MCIRDRLSKDPTICGGKRFIFGGINWVHWLIQMGFEISPKDYVKPDKLDAILESLEGDLDEGVVDHSEFCDTFL